MKEKTGNKLGEYTALVTGLAGEAANDVIGAKLFLYGNYFNQFSLLLFLHVLFTAGQTNNITVNHPSSPSVPGGGRAAVSQCVTGTLHGAPVHHLPLHHGPQRPQTTA